LIIAVATLSGGRRGNCRLLVARIVTANRREKLQVRETTPAHRGRTRLALTVLMIYFADASLTVS